MNVRIAVSEALNNGAIVCPPHENRSISWLRKRTCEERPRHTNDCVPLRIGATSGHVIHPDSDRLS